MNTIPDEPVAAKRKSRFTGELKIEYMWMSFCPVLFKIERIP